MTTHDDFADYLATGMKDYQRGLSLFKNLGVNVSDNKFFETENPSKIQIALLKQKLTYYAKIKNIRPMRIHTALIVHEEQTEISDTQEMISDDIPAKESSENDLGKLSKRLFSNLGTRLSKNLQFLKRKK